MSKKLMRRWGKRFVRVWNAPQLWEFLRLGYLPFENKDGRCLLNEATGHGLAVSPSGYVSEYRFCVDSWRRGQPSFLRWMEGGAA